MSAQRGSIFTTRTGDYGIRWRENDKRRQQTPFRTKTEARNWFAENVKPRLDRGWAPSNEITFDRFADVFLERHAATVSARTIAGLKDRLKPARARFGTWTLRELEHASADVATWRGTLREGSRHRHMLALRQCLHAAVRWHYLTRNPAVDAGPNPTPRADELHPFTMDEIAEVAVELGPTWGPLVIFAAETGLRTNEWLALERRDLDRQAAAITVQRRYSNGVLTGYPKTVASRRRVPLTDRALAALDALPPRLDTPLLFPATRGGHIELGTWRAREWYPALEAAGLAQRGPYCLRHTFATEALAAGVSIFQLARLMGTSVLLIDRTYGHLAVDTEDAIRGLLNARGAARVSADG